MHTTSLNGESIFLFLPLGDHSRSYFRSVVFVCCIRVTEKLQVQFSWNLEERRFGQLHFWWRSVLKDGCNEAGFSCGSDTLSWLLRAASGKRGTREGYSWLCSYISIKAWRANNNSLPQNPAGRCQDAGLCEFRWRICEINTPMDIHTFKTKTAVSQENGPWPLVQICDLVQLYNEEKPT